MSQPGLEPPSSPPLPASAPPPSILRKRSYVEDVDYSTSSDAVFSSDDGPDGIENYHQRRPKKMYRGVWWDAKESRELPRAKDDAKEHMKRNFDSGVWMGSDQSIDLPSIPSSSGDPGLLLEEDPEIVEIKPEQQVAAELILRECLEQGNEKVELT
jgi:hypothetical protein